MKDETMQALCNAIAEKVDIEEEKISPEMALGSIMDSLDLVEVVMVMEDKYGIEIADDHFGTEMSVDDLCEVVEKLRQL